MLSTTEMERQLETIPLHYVHYSYPPVEYGKGVWKGLRAYYHLRKEQPHLIPTEECFCREFKKRTIHLFPIEKIFCNYDKYNKGLEARAKRAYRALVREEHAIQRMREIFTDFNIDVLTDEEDDWKRGIDVTLVDWKTGRVHYVHLFSDTPHSWRARRHKEKRGQGRDFSTHVDLPFNRAEGKKVGGFYLYSDWQLMTFLKKLREEYKHKGVRLADAEIPTSC